MRSRRKRLLWRGIGLLFTAAGMLLFVTVSVDAFLAPPRVSVREISSGDVAWLLVAGVLIAAGRMIRWKFGTDAGHARGSASAPRNRDPERSSLERLGYRVHPESADETDPATAYENGELYVVCNECGAENERQFEYCSDCSARLTSD